MAREWAKAFYKSKEWQQCRDAYIRSVYGLCERCLANGKIVPGFIVHHKKHLTPVNINDPNITLNWDNLEYLCQDCHNKEHHRSEVDRRYKFDEDGNVISIVPL